MNKDEDRLGLDSYKTISCETFEHHDQLTDFFISETPEKYLKLIHLNIRSYYKNIDCALVLLESLKIKFDIIIFTEAWLETDKLIINLDNYDVFSTVNNWNRNDGVVVYCKTDLSVTSQQITLGEATGLQLDFDTDNRHFNLVAIYRSPSMNCQTFLVDLKTHYSNILSKNTYFFIGDINIDTLPQCNNTNDKDSYLNTLYNVGFTEYIDKPTRVTDHSVSCIDHIFVNHFDYAAVTSGILKTDVTDHYAILAKLKYCNKNHHDSDKVQTTYLDTKELHGLIERQSWEHVLALQDVNESC